MTKLCIDCKYVDHAGIYLCSHPNNKSLVTGHKQQVLATAIRIDSNRCGPEGRWFEAGTERFSSVPEIPEKPPLAG